MTAKPLCNVANRTMFIGDNLDVLSGINDECIDLIYLDPPFNSNRNYAAPIGSAAEGAGFRDEWNYTEIDDAWIKTIESEYPKLASLIIGIGAVNGKKDMAYLIFMARRLIEMKRMLKESGSIYLHCDSAMSHSLKLLMDCIFGKVNFRNEIIWRKYGGRKNNAKRKLSTQNECLLFYSKTPKAYFCPLFVSHSRGEIEKEYSHTDKEGRHYRLSRGRQYQLTGKQKKIYLDESRGRAIGNLWVEDGLQLNTSSAERTGFPTQKPLALLERVIKLSSNEGDIVLDPFCGCATACVAAERLSRNWIGIDLIDKAVDLIRQRLQAEENLWRQVGKGKHIIVRTDLPVRNDCGEIITNLKQHKKKLYGDLGGYCQGCEKHFEPPQLELDHITPQSKGGQDIESNLTLLCNSCNRIKGNRTMLYLHARLKETRR